MAGYPTETKWATRFCLLDAHDAPTEHQVSDWAKSVAGFPYAHHASVSLPGRLVPETERRRVHAAAAADCAHAAAAAASDGDGAAGPSGGACGGVVLPGSQAAAPLPPLLPAAAVSAESPAAGGGASGAGVAAGAGVSVAGAVAGDAAVGVPAPPSPPPPPGEALPQRPTRQVLSAVTSRVSAGDLDRVMLGIVPVVLAACAARNNRVEAAAADVCRLVQAHARACARAGADTDREVAAIWAAIARVDEVDPDLDGLPFDVAVLRSRRP